MSEDVVSIEEFLQWEEVKPKSSLAVEILALITNRPMSCTQIAKELGRKYATVFSCLQRLVKAGQVVKRYAPDGTPMYCHIEES